MSEFCPTVVHMSIDVEGQRFIAAYEVAAAEATAWAQVRDLRLWTAAQLCRHEWGMSMRSTAAELGVSRSTLARSAWNERGTNPNTWDTMSDRAHEINDEVLIRVGLGDHASPQARFDAGLISEFERDSLLDYHRRREMRIPDQIREAVEKYPGISNLDLPRMIVMAVPQGSVPDLRVHAEESQCSVDADDRWWPAESSSPN